MKSALFVTLLLVAFGCASAGLLPNYYKGKWFDLGKPILASTTVDCAVKTVAWKFAKVLLPEYLDNQAVYDSFQLQNCGVERPQADPVLKRPEEKYIYPGKDLYVDGTNGDDSNDGSFEHPFKTILHAIQASRSIEGKRVIYVRAGYYYIENPIVLSNVDEGLTITSYKNEEVIFSGAKKINVEWKSVTKDSWKVFSARNILGTMKYEPGQDIEVAPSTRASSRTLRTVPLSASPSRTATPPSTSPRRTRALPARCAITSSAMTTSWSMTPPPSPLSR